MLQGIFQVEAMQIKPIALAIIKICFAVRELGSQQNFLSSLEGFVTIWA